MEKKRAPLAKKPTRRFRKFLDRTEAHHSRVSKDDAEFIRQTALANTVIAESGRMLGRLEDKMSAFEQDDFDLDQFAVAHMSTLTEKGIGTLKNDLSSLQDRCEEEAQQEILGSYAVFVNACEGVAQVDAKFQDLRVLITSTTSLTTELKRAVQPGISRFAENLDVNSSAIPSMDFTSITNNRFESIIDELDVAIAERDFPIASKVLFEADKGVQLNNSKGEICSDVEIEDRRQKSVNLIENQLQDPTLGASDKHGLLQALSSVAGKVHAIEFFLNLYSQQIKQNCQQQAKPHRSGVSGHEGADYSGSLAQCTFHGIGLAVEDFRSVFDSTYSSQLCPIVSQWAERETKKCAELINTNALSAFGAVAGLPAVVESISIALVFAQALNNTHSICLLPVLRKELWPSLEGMIDKFFATSGDEILYTVHEEMAFFVKTSPRPWKQKNDSASTSTSSTTARPKNQVTMESAQIAVEKLRYLCVVLRPLWSPLIRAPLRLGIKTLINTFVEALAEVIKEQSADGMDAKTIDEMCEWLMNCIAQLVERQIPKELSVLERKTGVVFLKYEIDSFINNAAASLGLEQINESN